MPPEPLFAGGREWGIRWVSYDRPGYKASTPRPGRDIASAAADAASVADALGVGEFAVMGHSGGGPHALACGALLPGRVLAVAEGSGLAPFGADGLDWFAGMTATGAAEIRAAAEGRAALERYLAATSSTWSSSPRPIRPRSGGLGLAGPHRRAGHIERADRPDGWDRGHHQLANVRPWGFEPGQVTAAGPRLPRRPGPDGAERARRLAGRATARTPSCGCARTTGTSPSSAPVRRRPWTGWSPGPEGRTAAASDEPVSSPRCAAGAAG